MGLGYWQPKENGKREKKQQTFQPQISTTATFDCIYTLPHQKPEFPQFIFKRYC